MKPLPHEALSLFTPLPRLERLHVRARAASAPLDALAARCPAEGRVLDAGCGHGLLSALLAQGAPGRQVLGIDPDPRKVRWAQAGPGRLPNARFETARIEELLPREAGAFSAVVVADVLYLLTPEAAQSFLQSALALLAPGGRLVVNEAEDDGGWRARKWALQEAVMVRLLGRTHGAGHIGLTSREAHVRALETAGFVVDEVVSLAQGYTSPHLLLRAHRP